MHVIKPLPELIEQEETDKEESEDEIEKSNVGPLMKERAKTHQRENTPHSTVKMVTENGVQKLALEKTGEKSIGLTEPKEFKRDDRPQPIFWTQVPITGLTQLNNNTKSKKWKAKKLPNRDLRTMFK